MPAAAAVPSAPAESPARPPAYVDCYVCGRQFGSRSVALHVTRCLERWRAANATLPASERSAEPQPPPAAEPSLNSSWPRSNGRLRAALEEQQSPRVSRPRTATLKKPRVLDAEKKAELDMSTTRCNELLQLAAENRARRERPERAASEERAGRPQTIKLSQPSSRDLNVPNIDYRSAAVISPDGRAKATKATSKLGRRLPNFTRALEELFHAPRAKAGVPRPCMSCGKPENPERFHSHPAEPSAEPPRRAKRPSKKRMSIQRPVAIRYRAAGGGGGAPQPPIVDPVAQRKQQLEEEQRLKQQRLREEYLKKEEKSKKAREDAMRKKLAFTMAKQQRVTNGAAAPPRPEPCYVCGKPFGANSLLIHQPQCLEKWRRENDSLPEPERQPEPQPAPAGGQRSDADPPAGGQRSGGQPPPAGGQRSEGQPPPAPEAQLTDSRTEDQQQADLVPCRRCGRTFFPDRVQLHEKNCQPKDADAAAREAPAQVAPPSVCYICKARFPPDQLAAHEVECVSRWRAQNAVTGQQMVPLPALALPPQQQQSEQQPEQQQEQQPEQQPEQPPPTEGATTVAMPSGAAPTAAVAVAPSAPAAGPVEQLEGQLDALIDAAWQSHLSELVPCPNCARTFFPDRLEKHTKNCKVDPKQK
ncbi:zinc finger protein 474-like [Amphibalanus amphitrite]|uniref:zinc finger protein 474-like n=1 Tax=Amphibalanus amphitrite TaxID=1232801 RepID=UPI001C926DEB|nr:zinc finger protein 474-like [Amphibalanus amphitrite]XP_043217431.1 zinc finger protein 474-like [Amphibalanus amphitrite]